MAYTRIFAFVALFAIAPIAFADTIPLVSVSISSNNLATSYARVGDAITLTFIADPSVTVASTNISILGHSAVDVHSFSGNLYTATYAVQSTDPDGAVPFEVTLTDADGNVVDTTTTTNGAGVTLDNTHPILNSIHWNDADASGTVTPSDELVFTWSEPVHANPFGTSTLDTALTLSNGHTFGSTATSSWSGDHSVLTIGLGSDETVVNGDTALPLVSITDLVGNTDATPAALQVLDHEPTPPVVVTTVVSSGGHSGSSSGSSSGAVTPSVSTTTEATTTGQVLGASTFNFTRTLKFGSKGADVSALQTFLTEEKIYTGPITGYYGVLTRAAIKVYQTMHGLPAVGNVGPLTLALLNRGSLQQTQ